MPAADLTAVPSTALESLREQLEAGSVPCPLSADDLVAVGHRKAWPIAQALGGLDRHAALALVDAVLNERRARDAQVELVWTGPDARSSVGRDTAVVLRHLFESASAEVLIAGYCFSNGRQILAPLHQAMAERSVRVRVLMDVPVAEGTKTPEQIAVAAAEQFLAENWPAQGPYPELYYDPRCADPKCRAILHAKCLTVDGREAFVSSANFTRSGHNRNIEVGVLITGAAFAQMLARQLLGLINEGLVLPIPKR